MDLPESNVPNEQHSAVPVPSDSVMQLATVIAQVMRDAQSGSFNSCLVAVVVVETEILKAWAAAEQIQRYIESICRL
ncbi:hypothetical protein M5K25_005856 [Dendrobium thyrsiflorum]|uniref:Uncharacterized protein n=1 Tax=Dendrobium thyrsiflorum TaxID=117978 RepID=A0ABD0VA98_DENTH